MSSKEMKELETSIARTVICAGHDDGGLIASGILVELPP
jgi:hypothetical protein